MSIEQDRISLSFRSFQGFYEMIPAADGLWEDRITSLVHDIIRADNDNLTKHDDHAGLRLMDTFFSFPRRRLKDYLRKGKHAARILVLDPFTDIARLRFEMLQAANPDRWSGSPVYEASMTIYQLCGDLARINEDRNPISRPDPVKPWTHTEFSASLERLRDLSSQQGLQLELRFYSVVTDAPVYLMGNFAIKGLMLDRSGARDNPWLVFVDDVTESTDVFSKLSKNFEDIWTNASSVPREQRLSVQAQRQSGTEDAHYSAFIVMDMSDEKSAASLANALRAACRDCDYAVEAFRVDDDSSTGTILNKIKRNIADKHIILCDLSGARPNVYYEAGFAHGLRKPIIFTARKGTKIAFDLEAYERVEYEDALELKQKTTAALNKLIRGFEGCPQAEEADEDVAVAHLERVVC